MRYIQIPHESTDIYNLVIGDRIRIYSRDKFQDQTIKEVIKCGTDREYIINKSKNYHISANKYARGKSWAKIIFIRK